MTIRAIPLICGFAALLTLNSCVPLLVGGAAAGGYVAHKEGYRVQSPVTKESGDGEYDTSY